MTLSSPSEPTGFVAELGIERTLWTPGASRLELTLSEAHLNKGGVAHGGVHMVMLDSALGSALVASLKVEEWCATTQLSTSFLAAARPGERLVAEGRVVRRGKHVAHLAGEVKVGDRVVATASGTWAIWSSRPPSLKSPTGND
ncbi:MAG: PaaI family thioesterase [Candidatus Poseidoniales archaeon]|nr:MAG: PaaI family thioesterase [Candidatus Poseidoniales archaeon]